MLVRFWLIDINELIGIQQQETNIGQGPHLGANVDSFPVGHLILKHRQNFLVFKHLP